MRFNGLTIFVILFVVIMLLHGTITKTYNMLQVMDEEANSKWAQVTNQLKRRSDLIPNLVETVRGYAEHEAAVFSEVAQARAKLSGAISQGDLKNIQSSTNQFNSALGRLLAIAENYPQLKANEQFRMLTDELAGTENRIAVARMDYNNSVQALNSKIRVFPTSLIASILNIKQREYFNADETDLELPNVRFSDEKRDLSPEIDRENSETSLETPALQGK